MLTKGKVLVGLVGLALSPVILYYMSITAAGLGQMAENVTTGRIPAPIPRAPKFLRESKVYGPLIRPGDVVAQGQAREFKSYLDTGKHPLALFPPTGFRKSKSKLPR